MSDGPLVRTPLYDEHVALGGRIVDFHGFELPIWYSSISEEHVATRTGAGLFDVSHMGLFRFKGANVRGWLQTLATQRVTAVTPGRCAYTHFMDDDGHIIDDMIFAVTSEDEILGVPNASMIAVMHQWFSEHLPEDGSVTLEDLSDETAILALQGPQAKDVLAAVLGEGAHVGRFRWSPLDGAALGISGYIQGTGYTGEAGYEILVPNGDAAPLWRALIEAGATPVGLGARDTLRLEKGFLLSGVDFLWPSLATTEAEAFLARDSWETNVPFGWGFDHDHPGAEKMRGHGDDEARWWGVRYLEKGPLPRPGKPVTDLDGAPIGQLTSGAPAPSLDNVGIGIGYIAGVREGDEVLVQASPRKAVRALVVRPPFV